MKPRKSRGLWILTLPVLSGMSFVVVATAPGIGVSPDSASYLGAARNWTAGRGLTLPFGTDPGRRLTHFPPLLPAVLSLWQVMGVDAEVSCRWLHTIAFGANIFLVGAMVYRFTGGAVFASVLASLLFCLSPSMILTHAMAWSEPLFLLFVLAGMALLTDYVRAPARTQLLACCAAVALACLTRYAGIAFVLAGAAVLLIIPDWPWRDRIRRCVVYGALSSLPVLAWIVRNHMLDASAVDRPMSFHPIDRSYLQEAYWVFSEWVFPIRTQRVSGSLLLLLAAACWLAAVLASARRARPAPTPDARHGIPVSTWVGSIFILGYGLFLFAWSLLDDGAALNVRILAPVFPLGLIVGLPLVESFLRPLRAWHLLRVTGAGLCAILVASYCLASVRFAALAYEHGCGYSPREWRDSEAFAMVKRIRPNLRIYSNAVQEIYLFTGRSTAPIPMTMASSLRLETDTFESQLAALKEGLDQRRAVVVMFDGFENRWYYPSRAELVRQAGLVETKAAGNAVILVAKGAEWNPLGDD